MKRIKKVTLLTSLLVAISTNTVTFAAVQMPFGWYLEGNVGITKASSTSYGAGTSISTPGTAYNINAGYKFLPYFAAELGYTRYANTKVKFGGATIATDKHYAFDIAGKGILPIVDTGFELFAKVGAAMVRSSLSTSNNIVANALGLNGGTRTNTGFYLGAGGDYSITPNLPINIQWSRANGGGRAGYLDLYSIGVAYIFN